MKTKYIIAFAAVAMMLAGCKKNEMISSGVNDGLVKFEIGSL